MARSREPSHRATTILTIIGLAVGVAVAMLTRDVIIGVIAASSIVALAVSTLRLWRGDARQRDT